MTNQLSEIKRILTITPIKNPLKNSSATFLWGPRKTGKTTTLTQQYPNIVKYDLLDTRLKRRLEDGPHLLREEILAQNPSMVLIDEIQKVPALLDEVHWLIENLAIDIIMCGSSARKIKDYSSNLLGGRATKYELLALVTKELNTDQLELDLILNRGLLPDHFLSPNYLDFLEAYINDYLEEEIAKESRIRNLAGFSRFIKVAGITNGQLLNYSKVASESGVSPNTVREYYQILKDTLLGFEIPPWHKRKERRLIETSKFYFFDVGVANYLRNIHPLVAGTDIWGWAFEHFMIQEIRAYLKYHKKKTELYFFRTAGQVEVDLIIGEMEIAVEFKAVNQVKKEHLKGLRELKKEFNPQKMFLVSTEEGHRKTEDGIEIMNWRIFCEKLWNNGLS